MYETVNSKTKTIKIDILPFVLASKIYCLRYIMHIKALISHMDNFNFRKSKYLNKQQYITDHHYQWNTSLNFTEIPCCR